MLFLGGLGIPILQISEKKLKYIYIFTVKLKLDIIIIKIDQKCLQLYLNIITNISPGMWEYCLIIKE